MITKSNFLGIIVNDLAAATAYYRDTLGLTVDESESVPGFFTQFKLQGEAILALLADTEAPGRPAYEPALLVNDIDATYAAWKEKGVELLQEPNDKPFGRTFLFRTPDGHVLRAYQPPQ